MLKNAQQNSKKQQLKKLVTPLPYPPPPLAQLKEIEPTPWILA